MGVGGQRHAPAALPPGKTRYPLYRRLGRPQGRSGRVRKISPLPGFDPRTVQPVASRYTDSAAPAQKAVHKSSGKVTVIRVKFYELFQTDRRYEANGRFWQFRERALKLCFLPTQFIHGFCMDLGTNSDYFPIQH